MQQRFTLSPHGVIAFVLIVLMFVSEYTRQANTSWVKIGIDVLVYAVAILVLSLSQESFRKNINNMHRRRASSSVITLHSKEEVNSFLLLLGCHITFFFLIIGIWFVFGENNLLTLHANAILGGLIIPYLLLQRGIQTKIEINMHGVVAFVLICIMLIVGLLLSWAVVRWYFIAAIAGYAYFIALVTYLLADSNRRSNIQVLRLLLGFHLAFVLLMAGVVLRFKNESIYGPYFLASVAGGIVVPFLLLRAKP